MPLPYKSRLKITPGRAAALVAALTPLLYFYPATLGRLFLIPDDGLIYNVPLRVAFARMLAAGSLPLWNPYMFSGMPLLASAQPGVLFPLNWFYLIFPVPAASNLMMLSTYSLAGLGAYLYARRGGASVAGGLLTSFVWQACGFMVAQIGHTNVVQTAAVLPWIMWAADAYAETGRRRRGAVLAALVAVQVFAGHSQTNAYALILVAAYALAMAAASATREWRRSYLRALALVAAGLALAAVQILPTLELLRASLRAEATYDFFSSFSMPPRFALAMLAPYVTGGGRNAVFRAPYTGEAFYAEYIAYVGLAPLALAALAPLLRRDARTKFWAAAALVSLALALGRFLPLDLYALVYRVPLLNLFRVPARHLMEFDFALAVLAGRALTALSYAREASDASARERTRTRATVAVVCASLVLLTLSVVTVWRPSEFRLGRLGPVSFLRAPELFMPVVVAALSAWAVWNYARGKRRGAALLLFAVVALDLCLWGHASGWLRSPRRRHDLWSEPTVARLMREREGGGEGAFRVLTVAQKFSPEGPTLTPAVEGEYVQALQPNTYVMHGVENAAGYDGFGLERYAHLAGDMKLWGELTEPERTLGAASRELDILNVRYLIARNPRFFYEGQDGEQSRQSSSSATLTLGGQTFAEETFGVPALAAGERLVFETGAVEADTVALVTSLSWSAEVGQGAAVARVRLRTGEGQVIELDLRAGLHTSEWSHDRADTRASIKHRRAPVATSYKVTDPAGDHEGHTYVGLLKLPRRMIVTGGEIEALRFANAPKLSLGIDRITLLSGSHATPVARAQVRKSSAPEGGADAAGGEATGAPRARWRHVADEGPLVVYENTRSLPRAWLAGEALAVTDEAAVKIIRTGLLPDGRAWEPLTTALTDPVAASELAAAGVAGAGRAEVTRHEPNRVEVSAETDGAGMLVLAENHYPGWRAYVDGQAVETLRVNYNLRGVVIRPGRHTVTFVYRPKSALVGLLVSLLAAVALAAWCALEKREGRPRLAGRPSRAERDSEVGA